MLPRFPQLLPVFVVVAFGLFRPAESTVRLVNNGYEGVVVVIKDSLEEDISLIDRIKEEFTDASQLLFKATKHRAYFRNITIVVPKQWTKLMQYTPIPAINVFSEHIRVDQMNKVNGDKPYVRGNMECGKPGWYMHLTQTFLKREIEQHFGDHGGIYGRKRLCYLRKSQDNTSKLKFGKRDAFAPGFMTWAGVGYRRKTTLRIINKDVKVNAQYYIGKSKIVGGFEPVILDKLLMFTDVKHAIVHEWGHLRWGLFDEYASIAHPNANNPWQKINFYNEDGSWTPVTCPRATNVSAYRGKCDVTKPCNLNSIQLPMNCRFCPYKEQPRVKTSLMATQWLQTTDSFCEEDADTTETNVRHNSRAPNLQNKVCNGQSAWEVMRQHEDFKSGNQPTSPTMNTTPNFQVVQETGRIRMLVFDVSGSMSGNKIVTQQRAAWLAIDTLVEKGSWLGIVSFSGGSYLLANLTRIESPDTKMQLKEKVPNLARGGTNIYVGLALAVTVIETSNYPTRGTEIILFSDGQSSAYLHIIPDLQQKGIIVHTIAITNAADQGMTQLAQETGGRSFTYLETETVSLADVRVQVIATGSSDNEAVEKVFSESYDISAGSDVSGRFTIDQGLGNLTELTTLLTTAGRIYVSADVTDSNNKTYHIDDITEMLTLEIPDVAEVGNYYFKIKTNSVKSIPMIVSVTSRPISKESDVLRVTSRMSTTSLDFRSSEEIKVYADIEKGGIPVLNANVTATLAADTGFMPIDIVMLDSGTGADVIAMDGVYSAYLLKKYFTRNSRRYNVKINIVGDGNAFIYTNEVNMSGNSAHRPGEVDGMEFEEVNLDEFQRQSLPGVITVVYYISNPPDNTPPAKITDLRVENIRNNEELLGQRSITYTLSWTAVDDDMDICQATRYHMRIDGDIINLRKEINSCKLVPFTFNTPKRAGEQENVNLTLTLNDCNGTCFIALRAHDAVGLFTEISNMINVDVNFFYEAEEEYEPDEKFTQTTYAQTEKYTSEDVFAQTTSYVPTEKYTTEESFTQTAYVPTKKYTSEGSFTQTTYAPTEKYTSEGSFTESTNVPTEKYTSEENFVQTTYVPTEKYTSEGSFIQTANVPIETYTSEESFTQTAYVPTEKYTSEGSFTQTTYAPTEKYTSEGSFTESTNVQTEKYTSEESFVQTTYVPTVKYTSEEGFTQTAYAPTEKYTSEGSFIQTANVPTETYTSEESFTQTAYVPTEKYTSEGSFTQTTCAQTEKYTSEGSFTESTNVTTVKYTSAESFIESTNLPTVKYTSEESFTESTNVPTGKYTSEESFVQTTYTQTEQYTSEDSFTRTTYLPEINVLSDMSRAIDDDDDISTPADTEMIIGTVIATLVAAAICVIVVRYITIKRSSQQITMRNNGFSKIESGQAGSRKIFLHEEISLMSYKRNQDM